MTLPGDPMTQVVEELLQRVITDFTGSVRDADTWSFTCTDVSEFETFIWRQQDELASIGSYADFLYLIWMGTQSFEPEISESCARLHDVFTSSRKLGRFSQEIEATGKRDLVRSEVAVTTQYWRQNSMPTSSAVKSWLNAFGGLDHGPSVWKKRLFAVDTFIENESFKCLIWIGSPAKASAARFKAVQVKQRRRDSADGVVHWLQQALNTAERRHRRRDPMNEITSTAYFSCSALLWWSSDACVIEAAAAVEPYYAAARRRNRRAVDVYLGLIDPPFDHVGESTTKVALSEDADDDADDLSSARGLGRFLGHEDTSES